jgi:hypothetical protein
MGPVNSGNVTPPSGKEQKAKVFKGLIRMVDTPYLHQDV